MELSIGTLDRKIWSKDLILEALYKCFKNNDTLLIDFSPEGSCARSLGLYELLDKFCLVTGYAKNNITIKNCIINFFKGLRIINKSEKIHKINIAKKTSARIYELSDFLINIL